MMKPSLWMGLLVSALATGASGSNLKVQSQSSAYDSLGNRVDFSVTFNRVPDLSTADAYGRQADAFQYWIFYDNKPFQAAAYPELNMLIRGVEVYVRGDLPIRPAYPPAVGDPYYGGWGEIVSVVPYTLVGTTLSFSVDLGVLGDSDAKFAYRLDTYEYGDTTHSVFGGTAGPYNLLCEPNSLLMTAAGSLLLAVRRKRSAVLC